MMTWPIAWSVCATIAMPGARTPSSLLIRMRYGSGCGRACCARAGANSIAKRLRARSGTTARALGMAPRVSERRGGTPDESVNRPGQDAEEDDGHERCEQCQDAGDECPYERDDPDDDDDRRDEQPEQPA